MDAPPVMSREKGRRTTRPETIVAAEQSSPSSLTRSTLWAATAGAGLLWAALPPLGWWPLAWIASVPWLWLVLTPTLSGRRPYLMLWLASAVHWLAVLQGIRLPHWTLYFGWAALSLYLAVYLPAFVALTRVAVHRWRWPLWVSAPVVWVGLELARGHVATGFSAALLGHTQVRWIHLIQVADVFGAYGVSFLVMLVSAAVTLLLWDLPRGQRKRPAIAAGAAAVILAGALLYGGVRMDVAFAPAEGPTVQVGLLQGTFDTVFDYNPQRSEKMFRQYLRVAERAASDHSDLQLLVWPESTFTANNPNWLIRDDMPLPDELQGKISADEYRQRMRQRVDAFHSKAAYVADTVQAASREIHQLVGTETVDLRDDPAKHYNSAVLLDPHGNIAGRYDKVHLVMFGEYIPLANRLPWIYDISPMASGTAVGSGPEAFEIGGLRFAPTICFESIVPHLVRRQLVELEQRGTPADVLVNLTHDGWFWGSSILDLHMTCAVFRAVEHRRPMLTAANPGITAWIDGNGQVRKQLPRHQEDYLVAQVQRDPRTSMYRRMGDWPAGLCLIVVVGLAGSGLWKARSAADSTKAEGVSNP